MKKLARAIIFIFFLAVFFSMLFALSCDWNTVEKYLQAAKNLLGR